jgi:hypothetical protein
VRVMVNCVTKGRTEVIFNSEVQDPAVLFDSKVISLRFEPSLEPKVIYTR